MEIGPPLADVLGRLPWFRDLSRDHRAQMLDETGALPGTVVACVGGGSNAIGIFRGFVDDASVALVGVEADRKSTRLNSSH